MDSTDATRRPSFWSAIGRALRLRCPTCGRAPIFRGWFSMHERCAGCGREFDRAPGYLLGSIYVNYGVSALLIVGLYFTLFFTGAMTGRALLMLLTALGVAFPLWFFRYSRALWMAFDERWDPWPNEDERRAEGRESAVGSQATLNAQSE